MSNLDFSQIGILNKKLNTKDLRCLWKTSELQELAQKSIKTTPSKNHEIRQRRRQKRDFGGQNLHHCRNICRCASVLGRGSSVLIHLYSGLHQTLSIEPPPKRAIFKGLEIPAASVNGGHFQRQLESEPLVPLEMTQVYKGAPLLFFLMTELYPEEEAFPKIANLWRKPLLLIFCRRRV